MVMCCTGNADHFGDHLVSIESEADSCQENFEGWNEGYGFVTAIHGEFVMGSGAGRQCDDFFFCDRGGLEGIEERFSKGGMVHYMWMNVDDISDDSGCMMADQVDGDEDLVFL